MSVAARAPRVFIAYAPRAGLRCAVVCLASERDVYGWYTGSSLGDLESAYFVLEDYYTEEPTRFVSVRDADLHTDWIDDEARCHELAEMQDAFVHEWLFYRDDPQAAALVAQYRLTGLALGVAAVKPERLGRLETSQPTWTYASPGFEPLVLAQLAAHWPLDYATAAARERARDTVIPAKA